MRTDWRTIRAAYQRMKSFPKHFRFSWCGETTSHRSLKVFPNNIFLCWNVSEWLGTAKSGSKTKIKLFLSVLRANQSVLIESQCVRPPVAMTTITFFSSSDQLSWGGLNQSKNSKRFLTLRQVDQRDVRPGYLLQNSKLGRTGHICVDAEALETIPAHRNELIDKWECVLAPVERRSIGLFTSNESRKICLTAHFVLCIARSKKRFRNFGEVHSTLQNSRRRSLATGWHNQTAAGGCYMLVF